MRCIAPIVSLTAVLLLSACGGGGGDTPANSSTQTTEFVLFEDYVSPEGVIQCSAEDLKRRVDWDMRDYYIFYNQVPELKLGDYDSPELLIKDLRVAPDIYSSVRDSSTQTALFDEGETSGLGFSLRWAQDDVLRFREVQVGSPADSAGLLRGDELLTIDGRTFETIPADEVDAIFAPENSPVLMTVRTGDEEPRSVVVAHEVYRWITAGPAAYFSSTTNTSLPKVGYLPIRSFLETTKAEIDRSLAYLENAGGAEELIIDLRYNGGGRTSVARYLGAVVGGAAVEGKIITETKWNDKYSSLDSSQIFESVSDPLNLPRVFVLTTDRTASASEIFINSLKPYIEVVVIGDVTSGKIFTSNGREYCGKTINAMRSIRTNSVGVSVQGGIQPDCLVEDNWVSVLQSSQDPLVRAALGFASNGSCDTITADASSMQPSDRQSDPRSAPRNRLIYEPEDPTRFVADDD